MLNHLIKHHKFAPIRILRVKMEQKLVPVNYCSQKELAQLTLIVNGRQNMELNNKKWRVLMLNISLRLKSIKLMMPRHAMTNAIKVNSVSILYSGESKALKQVNVDSSSMGAPWQQSQIGITSRHLQLLPYLVLQTMYALIFQSSITTSIREMDVKFSHTLTPVKETANGT